MPRIPESGASFERWKYANFAVAADLGYGVDGAGTVGLGKEIPYLLSKNLRNSVDQAGDDGPEHHKQRVD